MKLSRYNIEKKEDKSCLIYNTVTSAILELVQILLERYAYSEISGTSILI